jgi:MFS family permease
MTNQQADRHSGRPLKTTLILCLIEILALMGIATFPALLPTFMQEWQLSHTQAGWVSAVYYAGYMLAVPPLVGATDRLDARGIVLAGTLIAALAALGFALLARGFWTALGLRFLAGISLAGIYMPGLKIVSDHAEGMLQSRYVSFYTASFSVGLSLSYLVAGEVASMSNWRWSFALAAFCAAGAAAMTLCAAPRNVPKSKITKGLLNFKRVFEVKEALGYIFGYAAHMWELFSLRAWIVAFLFFSQSLQPGSAILFRPTRLAFWITLIGLPASVFGNEIARRYGRRQVISIIMIVSALLCVLIGFNPALPFLLVAALCLLHGVTVVGDSAALTAGAVGAAPAGYRGATLALHSTIGFGAAFLGPLTVGIVLDALHGSPRLAWGSGFVVMAIGCALGPIFLMVFGRKIERTEEMPP